jgi:hypothetical protein
VFAGSQGASTPGNVIEHHDVIGADSSPRKISCTPVAQSGVLADFRPDPANEFRTHRNGFLPAHRSKWDQAAVNHEIMARSKPAHSSSPFDGRSGGNHFVLVQRT